MVARSTHRGATSNVLALSQVDNTKARAHSEKDFAALSHFHIATIMGLRDRILTQRKVNRAAHLSLLLQDPLGVMPMLLHPTTISRPTNTPTVGRLRVLLEKPKFRR